MDAKFLNDKMLREPALESLISRKLLEDYVEKNKMVVGKATMDERRLWLIRHLAVMEKPLILNITKSV